MSSPSKKRFVTPDPLPLYKAGREKPSLLSAEDRNAEVRTLNALRKLTVIPESSGKFIMSDGRVVLDLTNLPLGSVGSTTTGGSKEMLVKTVYANHLDCCEITDTGLTGTTTPVAKQSRNRQMASEVLPKLDGSGNVTVYYTYSSITGFLDNSRKASASGFSDQYEILFPYYLSGDIITVVAIASITLDTVACVWEECSPRRWTQYA